MRRMLVAMIVLALSAGACGNGGEAEDGRPSSSATVTILEPESGAVVSGAVMTIRVDLQGGTLVEEASLELTPHEGHLHISIDGRVVAEIFDLTERIEVPEPGRRILEVEFVAKDHGPFSPRVLASVPFEVEG